MSLFFLLSPSGKVSKWSVNEILTIGDKKCKAIENSNLLSPSVAFSDTFPEGDGRKYLDFTYLKGK